MNTLMRVCRFAPTVQTAAWKGLTLALLWTVPLVLPQTLLAQCATTYQDRSSNGTIVYAWTTLTDNYTDPAIGCAPGGWGSFVHTYTSTVTITSPSGRTDTGSGEGSQPGGTITGYSRADASLAILGETDPFTVSTREQIDCTVAGPGFYIDIDSFSFTPSQHTYPNNPWLAACRIAADFDRITGAGRRHGAQDVSKPGGTEYGDVVFAPEPGTVTRYRSDAVPAPVGYPACEGQGYQANFVELRGDDQYITRYVHVQPNLAIVCVGCRVETGQPIGTVDNSGCVSAAHTHVGRYNASGVAVNFTFPGCTYPSRTDPQNLMHDSFLDFPYYW